MAKSENEQLGVSFFKAQDRLHGGPDPDLCNDNYSAEIAGNPPMPLAGHQQFAQGFYAAFPDIYHTIEETVADDDRVAVRFTLRGTNSGDFFGMPPTGKAIEVSAIAILTVVNGRVAKLRAVFDQAGMMRQLGAG